MSKLSKFMAHSSSMPVTSFTRFSPPVQRGPLQWINLRIYLDVCKFRAMEGNEQATVGNNIKGHSCIVQPGA